MHEAAHLLRESDGSLGAIAERVGCRSEVAFNRAFHREMGAPPGAYRTHAAARPTRASLSTFAR